MKINFKIISFLCFMFLIAACQPELTALPPITTATAVIYSNMLESVATSTQQPEGNSQPKPTLTPVPAPTATPQLHNVALDETMLSIAYEYGISYDELQAANPDANPYALIVGQVLIIPSAPEDSAETRLEDDPYKVILSEVHCTPDAAGGLWCLLSAQAPQDEAREIASVQITLNGAGSNEALEVTIGAPLNRLDAGQRMPLAVYVDAQTLQAAPFSAPYQARVDFARALPLNNATSRYLALDLSEPDIALSTDGRSAQVETTLTLAADNPQSAAQVWLVAAAYNAEDECIGLRRWEAETPLAPGESVAVSLTVFSVDGSAIEQIEVLAEARP